MSDTTTAVALIEKKRMQLFKQMPPALQEVAQEFETKLCQGARGIILLQFDMGMRIRDVMKDEGSYGSGAVSQLAAYLPLPGNKPRSKETMLYNLQNFAEEFDKEYVKQWSNRPMASGNFLELAHWLQLMKIKDKKDQEKMLVRVLKNSLSANDLEREIRGGSVKVQHARQGGRKPQRPSSAIAGLHKTFAMAQQLARYEEVAEKDVFDVIEEMPADDVNETLKERLEKTIDMLGKTEEKAGAMKAHGEKCLERVERVLEQKAEDSEESEEGEEEEAPKKKVKAKASAKASANGHANGHDGKKKKAKKKAKVAAAADEDED